MIVDKDANIVGFIDWEKAILLPLGCYTSSVRWLSVTNIKGIDYLSERTPHLANAFWKGFWSTMPKEVTVDLTPNLVTAMQIGFIFARFWGSQSPSPEFLEQDLQRLQWMEDTFLNN